MKPYVNLTKTMLFSEAGEEKLIRGKCRQGWEEEDD